MPQPFYRRNLPHLQRDCEPHFLTFCTYGRWILPDWARAIVMGTSLRANQWTIDLRALVVMPDHVHMIFVPLIDVDRSDDRVLRVSEKLDEKIAYILDNPVRKGLAASSEEYRWLWVASVSEPSSARPGR